MFYHKWVRTAGRFARQFFYFVYDANGRQLIVFCKWTVKLCAIACFVQQILKNAHSMIDLSAFNRRYRIELSQCIGRSAVDCVLLLTVSASQVILRCMMTDQHHKLLLHLLK